MRMLMNNLDPDVAERPEDLIVYGGAGKAARDWPSYHRIVSTLQRLNNDETLLVQSGKPVGVFRTHEEAPRVLIANANLVPRWANWDEFRRLDALGLTMYGQMTAGSWIYIGTQGILQGTYETFAECARQHFGGTLAGRLVVTAGLGGMGGAQPLAVTMNERRLPRRRRRRRRASSAGSTPGTATPWPTDLDAALALVRAGASRAAGASRSGWSATSPRCCRSSCGAASRPTWSRTRPRPTISGSATSRSGSSLEQAARAACADPKGYERRGARLDGGARRAPCSSCRRRGAVVFDYGNNLRGQVADLRGHAARRSTFPVSCPRSSGRSSAAARGRSAGRRSRGIPRTSASPTTRCSSCFRSTRRCPAGFTRPARRCTSRGCRRGSAGWSTGSAPRCGLKFNWLVKTGKVEAPIVIGRDHLDTGSVASPNRETEGMMDGSDAIADWPLLNAMLNTACGASWVSLHHGGGVGHRVLDPRRDGGGGRRHRDGRPPACSGC